MNTDSILTRATALEEAVEDALQAAPSLSRAPIGVAVQGTTVSLTGRVASEAAKDRAEQAARRVPGVLDVTNELVVVPRGVPSRRPRRMSMTVDAPFGASAAFVASGAGTARMGGGVGSGMASAGAVAALGVAAAAQEATASYHILEDSEEVKG
jgi:hypothetical protein